jgi:hypothetical protein
VKIIAFVLMCLYPALASAQATVPIPDAATEPQGFVAEPDIVTRVVLFADRHLGKGDLTSGYYVDFDNMIPGAGWLSIGPGYRRWYGKDTMLLDASAAMSWNKYKNAQARVELPKFAKSRLALGAQVKWLDYGEVDYYGVGPDTPESARTDYGVTATHAVAHATLRPFRWFDIGAEIGVLSPSLKEASLGRAAPAAGQPTFMPAVLSMKIDTRNFPGHPTSGALLRAAASHYDDRHSGAFTFRRYDGEAAGFLPMAGERLVLALHGWVVSTETENGRSVPFYLLPSLGGANTLRSFADYRFHDRHMAVANAELRLALMTHVDLAMFVDAGNVAPRFEDLDFDKRSYGAGLRLHTRRQTTARLDVAQGREGWRVLFKLSDPLALKRVTRKTAAVPFVPSATD